MSSVNLIKAMKLRKLLRNTWQSKKYISAALLIYCPSVYATSLQEVVDITLKENLSLKSSALATDASSKDSRINLAKFLPTIDVSANTTWTESETEKTGGNSHAQNNSHGYSATVRQSIFNLTDILSQYTSNIDLDIQQLQLAQTRQQVIQDVASAYFEVLKNMAQERATRAEFESSRARYKQIKRNVELGNVAGSEVYEVLAQKEQVASDLRTLKKDRVNLERELENLVQYPVSVSYDLVPTSIFEPIEPSLVSAMTEIVQRENFDILISKQEVAKNKSLLRESQADFAPTISGSISYSYTDSNAPSSDPADTGLSNQTVYSLNMNIPIFSGGSDYYEMKKSSLQHTQAQIDFQDQVNNTLEAFNTQISNINDYAESMQSLESIIVANYASYVGIQKAYKLGTRTITDLLASESKLFKSIRDYENAKYTYVIETLGLEKLLGRLNEQSIKAIEALMVSKATLDDSQVLPLHLRDKVEVR